MFEVQHLRASREVFADASGADLPSGAFLGIAMTMGICSLPPHRQEKVSPSSGRSGLNTCRKLPTNRAEVDLAIVTGDERSAEQLA